MIAVLFEQQKAEVHRLQTWVLAAEELLLQRAVECMERIQRVFGVVQDAEIQVTGLAVAGSYQANSVR